MPPVFNMDMKKAISQVLRMVLLKASILDDKSGMKKVMSLGMRLVMEKAMKKDIAQAIISVTELEMIQATTTVTFKA